MILREAIAKTLSQRFGVELEPVAPPDLAEIRFTPPRVAPPAALGGICSDAPYDRAGHTYGKAFRDVIRALRRDGYETSRIHACHNRTVVIDARLGERESGSHGAVLFVVLAVSAVCVESSDPWPSRSCA